MTAAVSQKGCSQRCCSAGGCRRSRRARALSALRASPGPAAPLAAEERGSGPSQRATSCGPGRPGARRAQVARLWSRLTMHCHAELRLSSPGQLKAARRRYKTFMIDEILSKETCDYFEKLSLYSVCPSLVVRPKPLHSCTGKTTAGRYSGLLYFCPCAVASAFQPESQRDQRILFLRPCKNRLARQWWAFKSVCNRAWAGTALWMGDELRPSGPWSETPM